MHCIPACIYPAVRETEDERVGGQGVEEEGKEKGKGQLSSVGVGFTLSSPGAQSLAWPWNQTSFKKQDRGLKCSTGGRGLIGSRKALGSLLSTT